MRLSTCALWLIFAAPLFGCSGCDEEAGTSNNGNLVDNDDPSSDPPNDCIIGSTETEGPCPNGIDLLKFEASCADNTTTVRIEIDGGADPAPALRQDWNCTFGAQNPVESVSVTCAYSGTEWIMRIDGDTMVAPGDSCGPNSDGSFGFAVGMDVVTFDIISFGCSVTLTDDDGEHTMDRTGRLSELVCL